MRTFSIWKSIISIAWSVPVVLTFVTPGIAPAQTAQERAELKRLRKAASEASEGGNYQQALSALEAAFALTDSAWPEDDPKAITTMHNLATMYHSTGRYTEAEPLYRRALAAYQRVLGKEHPHTLIGMSSLASLYHSMGRYAEAEPLLRRALEVREQALGKNHPDTLSSLRSLASLYHFMGRYAEAEPLFLRVLEEREKLLGKDHVDTLTTESNLASLYHSMGRYAEAEPLSRRALEIREQVLGKDHSDTLSSLRALAGLYISMGRYAEAEPIIRRALESSERVLGKDHRQTLTDVDSLASLYHSMGRYAEAEPLFLRVLEEREQLLGKDHPDTLASESNLAGLYHSMGRYAEAEPLLQNALKVSERVLGKDHPNTLISLSNLATHYSTTGRYVEAEPLYLRAVEVSEGILGKDHPGTLSSVNNLAGLYHYMGRYAEAEPFYLRVLEERETVLGKDHPDTLTSVSNLADLYHSMGRYAEAESLYLRALEIRERVLGTGHPDTLASEVSLARLYDSMGRYAEAESLYLRALEIRERVLGKNHPDTMATVTNLAGVYTETGRSAEAEPLYLRALKISERVLGKDHPQTIGTVSNLAMLYNAMGRYSEAESLFQRALENNVLVSGKEHPLTLMSLNNLAFLYQGMRRTAEAEPLYLRALEGQERVLGMEHPHTLNSVSNLSLLRLSLGDVSAVAEAVADLRRGLQSQAQRVMEQLHAGAGEGLRAQFATDGNLRNVSVSAALAFPDHAALGARALLLTKGVAGETDAALSRLISADPQPAVAEAAQALRKAEGTLFAVQQSSDVALIESARNARDAARQALFRRIDPPLVFQPEALNPKAVGEVLTDGQIFLDYGIYLPVDFASGERQAAHVVLASYRPGQPPELFDLGPADALLAAILTLSDMKANLEAPLEGAQTFLSKALLDPVAKLLAEADEAIIAPDGILARINFAMLPDPQDTDLYLSERLPIRILPSGRSLLEQPDRAPAASRLFLGAALQDYGPYDKERCKSTNLGDNRDGLCPLPNAVPEVEKISALFTSRGEARTLLRDQATEDSIRSALPGTRFVHLATHGGLRLPGLTGSGGGLNNVGLAFHRTLATPDNQSIAPSNDGILTGAEAARLPLWGTDLVVLSACDTALGEDAGAEGIWSMAHGFRLAGVRTVMMTLWKVNDETAPQFMERFYQTLMERRQTTPDENITTALRTALRETRLWAINEGWNYWDYAPFVLLES